MVKRYAACVCFGDIGKPTSYGTFDSIRECLDFFGTNHDGDTRTACVLSDWSDETNAVHLVPMCTKIGAGEWTASEQTGATRSLLENIESVNSEGVQQ